jgi:hypothetical protein
MKKYYIVTWNLPIINEHQPIRSKCSPALATLDEAEKFADEVCREYSDFGDPYHFQVHNSIKIQPSLT